MSKRHQKKRWQPWMTGLIAVALTVFAFYLGFAKSLPFTGHGYQISAVFSNAQEIRVKSPVRIAGVNVGKVTEVDHLVTDGKGQQAAVVKMELSDDALPIKQDATMEIRPRLFLEGNLFVDLHPGSPSAPEINSGSTVPIAQTSTSVQLDQVLTTLQAPVRSDLQTFLVEFGNALDKYGGGAGLQTNFRSSPAAYRYTAEVNQAVLGTQPGDLTGLVVNLDSFIRALNGHQAQLQDLVTNLGTVLNAFGKEGNALETAIFTLPQVLSEGQPALVNLNAALPQLRAFAREALPGARSANPALDAANPFIAQLRALVAPDELSGLVNDLRPTIPSVANLSSQTVPFFEQARALSSCFNNVIIPWSLTNVPNADNAPPPIGDGPAGPVYKETGYGLVGISGESRSGDANGQYIRVGAGGGPNTITFPSVPGLGTTFGSLLSPILGAQPALFDSAKTPFNPTAPCENQDPPNLNTSTPVPPPGQTSGSRNTANTAGQFQPLAEQQGKIVENIYRAQAVGGKRGAAQQAKLFQQLQQFYKDKLPAYRRELRSGN
jgi:virulence factor Mce-like protein